MVTAKMMIAYLYFEECDQDNGAVMRMICQKIRPSKTNKEIEEIASKHPEWMRDYVCCMDENYPDFFKTRVGSNPRLLFYPKAKETELFLEIYK